jgi:hypothetical protein
MLKNFILSFSCIASICAFAQTDYKNIELKSEKGVFSPYEPCEPSIAIDPTNPTRMVAGLRMEFTEIQQLSLLQQVISISYI